MRPLRRATRRLLIATLAALAMVPAGCSVTWREPEIQPLNPVRQYPAPVPQVCDGVLAAIAALDLAVDEITRDDAHCLVQTVLQRLSERGDDVNHLDKVAYVTPGDAFAHGRYTVTASVGQARDDLARVRLTTRIEGYDAGYRLLRSRGILEQAFFDHLRESIGVDSVSDS